MEKKITKGYVNHFVRIKFTQTLPSGRHIWATYVKVPDKKWAVYYSTDSAYPICQYTGEFKGCNQCEVYLNSSIEENFVKKCIALEEKIDSEEMARRANDCIKAIDCTVDFMGF